MWNPWSIIGQQVNAVLMGEVYCVIQCPRNHRWYISGELEVYLNRYGKYGWNVKHDACMWNLWWIRGQHVNAVLTVVIDNVIKFHGNHMWYVSGELVVYLNRYDNYRWSVSHYTCMWNPWWITGQHVNAVLMVEFDYVIKCSGNHMWCILSELKVCLDRYGSYGWNVVMTLVCGIHGRLWDNMWMLYWQ